jgi:hypothetical protein
LFAQLIQGGTTPDRRDEMARLVTESLIPALRDEPGYAGALNPVDRGSGNAMMVVFWETKEQAERPLDQYGSAFVQALALITGISTGQRSPISVWEVNARE